LESTLFFAGLMAMLIGSVWSYVAAFQVSLLWGFGVLLLPILWFVFLVLHWREAGRPFIVTMGGVAMFVLAVAIHPAGAPIKIGG
jgi:hypothetical protein